MKNYHFLRTIITISFVLCVSSVLAIPSYPEKAYGRPWCFRVEATDSYLWEKKAENCDFGEQTSNAWIVYACNEGQKAYENPSLTSAVMVDDIHFMENFYVADIKDGFALLFYYNGSIDNNGLKIPDVIKRNKSVYDHNRRKNGYVGWIPIDDLLLWNIALREKDGVLKKITIVKDVEVAVDFEMPEMFVNAACSDTGVYRRKLSPLDFYFTLKKKDGNALVCADYKLDSRMVGAKVGWVREGDFIDWNTRVCWEPAFGESKINDFAYTFSGPEEARVHDMTKKVSTARILKERYSVQFEPRSPVVSYNPSNSTANLSVLANKTGDNSTFVETMKSLDTLKRSLGKVNIVFVMDATNSMRPCFSAMKDAVLEVSKHTYFNPGNGIEIRFGVVAYRNYDDKGKPYGLVVPKNLTSNISVIADFLSSDTVKATSVSKNPQEAMFYGLNYAVDNMNWNEEQTNFIILISDVTSKSPDKMKYTEKTVAQKLASKKVNLIAFQARSQKDTEYQEFGRQVSDIISNNLRYMGYPTNNIDYDNKWQIYYFNKNYTKKWPYRPMGYKKKLSSDDNVDANELKNLAVNMIEEFITITQDNIRKYEETISGIAIDESVVETLINIGKIRSKDELPNMMKISGYAQLSWTMGKRMFIPCVFYADQEFDELLRQLESATSGRDKNRRGNLQKECKRLLLSYTRQKLNEDTFGSDLEKMASSIEKECGYSFDPKFLELIKDPSLLDDDDIKELHRKLKNATNNLRSLQNDPNTYKLQGDNKYYYILLKDMPFVNK